MSPASTLPLANVVRAGSFPKGPVVSEHDYGRRSRNTA